MVSTPVTGSRADELAGRDVGRRIDRELQRDRQLGQIDVVAFDDDLVPGRRSTTSHGMYFWQRSRNAVGRFAGFDAEACGQQLAVAGDVGDHRHVVAVDVLEHDDRALPRAVELEHHRGRVEMQIDRLTNAQQFVRIFGFHHAQETAQALLVAVDVPQHAIPLMSLDDGTFAASKRHP